MSRVYFHTPSDQAELAGSERHWLGHLATGPGIAAWDLDGTLSRLDRAVEVVSMVPEVDDGVHGSNYLHTYMRAAIRQKADNEAAFAAASNPLHAGTDYRAQQRFVQALQTRLRLQGVELHVAGQVLHSSNLASNTALVAGSDPVRLAAKIYGWCEVHCWAEGADRAWLADLIEQGLQTGLYRPGMNHTPHGGTEQRWISQGWDQVQELLRSRDDEPVVLSYSGCDQFPDVTVGGWLPAWPDNIPKTWEGYESLPEEAKRAREERQEAWYELDNAEKWRISMDGLRAERPWARLAPDTLAAVTFGPSVTVYDLFAHDRDERIRRACAADAEVGA